MKLEKCKIEGLWILTPAIFKDDRGCFSETYNREIFEKMTNNKIDFVQDNESISKYGTLRGLHFQTPPFAQSKLVRVSKGKVLDVAVDLRNNSATYGQHQSIILSDKNKKQLFIPRGFAHGFIVLSEEAIFTYKVDNNYASSHDSGIVYNDPQLQIDWNLSESEITTSVKDKNLQSFDEYKSKAIF